MSVQSTSHRPANRPAAVFVRFVMCGGGVGVASSGALILLDRVLPLVVANALITLVSTVIATEVHQRVTFRSPRGGWAVHLQSSLTVALSFALTTGALLILREVSPKPAALVEQGVYLSVSALAGIIRFIVLRAVFSDDKARDRASERMPALQPARRIGQLASARSAGSQVQP
ncbi:hypothetical protein AB0D33_13110 [Streptomyces sp. NPDC048404]|uniref:hypothetical protein n=1 Tax=unclassified Streptomyces TaxID=2593676 RepID=UPI0034369DE1